MKTNRANIVGELDADDTEAVNELGDIITDYKASEFMYKQRQNNHGRSIDYERQ